MNGDPNTKHADSKERFYPERPKITNNITIHKECGCGEVVTTITFKIDDPDYAPFEVFCKLGRANSCAFCMVEAITRAVTIGLRCGIPARVFVGQLEGIKCPSMMVDNGQEIFSCVDAIGKSLREYMEHVDDDTIYEYVEGAKHGIF